MTDMSAIHAQIRDALSKLDGTSRSHIRLITGFTDEQIDDLGGLPGERE